MATGLFISASFIKANTNIDGNVDDKYIVNTIADAQKMHIRPIIGTALFDSISAQIIAGTTTSLNQGLLNNYIQDALKYWVLYEGVDVFHYKITNKAVMEKSSDNSQPVQTIDIIRIKDSFRDKAQFFSKQCSLYLLANIPLFPLFVNPGVTIDTVFPNVNNYTTGWNIDDKTTVHNIDVDKGQLNY